MSPSQSEPGDVLDNVGRPRVRSPLFTEVRESGRDSRDHVVRPKVERVALGGGRYELRTVWPGEETAKEPKVVAPLVQETALAIRVQEFIAARPPTRNQVIKEFGKVAGEVLDQLRREGVLTWGRLEGAKSKVRRYQLAYARTGTRERAMDVPPPGDPVTPAPPAKPPLPTEVVIVAEGETDVVIRLADTRQDACPSGDDSESLS